MNTEVITSIAVSVGQADPDNPVKVKFKIGNKTYDIGNVYYPSGDSQLAWVKWKTPSTPQIMTITAEIERNGKIHTQTITANVVDLSDNEPPNPVADDRNDSFIKAESLPNNYEKLSAEWGVWKPYWHLYAWYLP